MKFANQYDGLLLEKGQKPKPNFIAPKNLTLQLLKSMTPY